MRSMRRPVIAALVAAAAFGVVQSTSSAGSAPREYVVLYERGASAAQAREAVEDAGGRIVSVNSKIGVATVRSSNKDFRADAAAEKAIVGAAANRPIGHAPKARATWQPQWGIEKGGRAGKGPRSLARPGAEGRAARRSAVGHGHDRRHARRLLPQAARLQEGPGRASSTPASTRRIPTSRRTSTAGCRGTSSRTSRLIDGPCEVPSCKDPADVDQGGHGTHVAGTVGAAINGVGIAGVAPKVDLVNLRGGQDSGFFFLQPSVDALTYAGDHGIDVVNMSYYIDPWLYNCADNPADSPEAQLEQRTIIAATQRALDYARHRGVTLISALGNEDDDLGAPEPDDTQPGLSAGLGVPPGRRQLVPDLPTEGKGVIGVSAVGPSKRKAFYSNYGTEQTDVSAPGGDSRDTATGLANPANRILSPYPESALREECELSGYDAPVVDCQINMDGTPGTAR